ncbi:MAG: 1,4-alpha-glucan branching protein GlgB [bacterium]|nr:1,4-alpha-glucan branching protein GlgB [bacterium]
MGYPSLTNVPSTALESLFSGDHGAPFDILGAHDAGDGQVVIRTFRPGAQAVTVILDDPAVRMPMAKVRDAGLFEAVFTAELPVRYRLEEMTHDGTSRQFHDAYAFKPEMGELDEYLFRSGKHLNAYDYMGAHLESHDGVAGVRFAVWAPNAFSVSVIGDFNGWDGRVHPMTRHDATGIWELFIPGVGEYALYRYRVRSLHMGFRADKSDPYAFASEVRPNNASVVKNIDGYAWGDESWMAERATINPLTRPMAAYEVHLGSWRRHTDGRWLTYRELADTLIPYVKDLGYTHLELLPVAEHPFDGSWGYQVTGYFAPTSRHGTADDFMYFVDQCHQHGIGVILDWVPAHFPKDGHALAYFDGTHLYEHADSRKGEHPDWGTLIFNYGRNEVRNFLIANALFWLKQYHIDGLRVDAVSSMLYLDFSRKAGEWMPNEYGGNENLDAVSFLREVNTVVHQEAPGAVTIAEESTAWAMVSRPVYIGGLGFTFKWNMGWMHDTLDYVQKDPIYRRYQHNKLTFSLVYAFNENFVLSLSHDEVVHGKGSLIDKVPGDWWQKFATLRMLYGYQWTHPGKKLLFMGQEFGQWREWSEARGLDWELLEMPAHQGLHRWMRDLNHLYQREPALFEHDFDYKGFQWIDANDADNSAFTYIRFADDPADCIIVAANFTPIIRREYRIGVPAPGHYVELLNSDSAHYGGGDVGNSGGIDTVDEPSHGFAQSLRLTLPPLGLLILKVRADSQPPAEPVPESLAAVGTSESADWILRGQRG